jgi:hypothetical protein
MQINIGSPSGYNSFARKIGKGRLRQWHWNRKGLLLLLRMRLPEEKDVYAKLVSCSVGLGSSR